VLVHDQGRDASTQVHRDDTRDWAYVEGRGETQGAI
jgi:hypothetical protein